MLVYQYKPKRNPASLQSASRLEVFRGGTGALESGLGTDILQFGWSSEVLYRTVRRRRRRNYKASGRDRGCYASDIRRECYCYDECSGRYRYLYNHSRLEEAKREAERGIGSRRYRDGEDGSHSLVQEDRLGRTSQELYFETSKPGEPLTRQRRADASHRRQAE